MQADSNGIELSLPARAESSPKLRSALRAFLARTPLRRERTGDVLLAVGEATSNAIEHAYSEEKGTVRLSAATIGCWLVIEVRDSGHWRFTASPDRGRGLGIMRALVDRVSIENSGGGTSVRLEVAL